MANDVIEDLIAGSVTFDKNGYSATRIFLVHNIPASIPGSGTASELPHSHLFNIFSLSAIPNYGDVHPSVPSINAYGLNVAPVNEEASVAKVTINYSIPTYETKEPDVSDPGLIQVGSTVTAAVTNKDKDGTPVTVSLTGYDDQLAELEILVPEVVFNFERRESASPITKAITYVGHVNSSSVASYAAKTLLCIGIEGVSNDDGANYSVSYRFQYNPSTWRKDVVYIDPETSQPHKDVSLVPTKAGVTEDVDIYLEANFNTLNLDF